MIFYIEPKGQDVIEFLAENGEYIGSLNSPDSNAKALTKEDISINNINEKLKEQKYLISLVFYNTWQICILANTADGLNEIKTRYKSNQILWYWLGEEYIQQCLPNMQYKEFKRIFNA